MIVHQHTDKLNTEGYLIKDFNVERIAQGKFNVERIAQGKFNLERIAQEKFENHYYQHSICDAVYNMQYMDITKTSTK
jgi:hypothetical protein